MHNLRITLGREKRMNFSLFLKTGLEKENTVVRVNECAGGRGQEGWGQRTLAEHQPDCLLGSGQ